MKSQMNTVTDKHTTRSLIRLHAADNVLIARAQLALGQQIDIAGATVRLRSQVPAGLEPQVAEKLRVALKKAILSPEFKQACERIDAPVMYQDADDYRKYVLSQYVHEKRLIEKLNLKEQIKNG